MYGSRYFGRLVRFGNFSG